MKKILQLGNPKLEKKSKVVENPKSSQIQGLIKELVSICKKNEEKTGGLAAPQIGENVQVVVVRRTDIEDEKQKKGKTLAKEQKKRLWEVFINPTITKLGKKKTVEWEGCLSVENGRVFGPVRRPSLARVEYLDRYGNKKVLTAVGYFSNIVQHEIDHLKGILFVKYIKNPENLWKDRKLDKYIKEHGEFPEVK